MWLKHRQHPLAPNRSRGSQGCLDFRRMMAVIVDQQKPRTVIFNFEPAPRVLKLCQCLGDFIEAYAELGCERDYTQRVANVVFARNIEDGFAKFFFVAIDVEG